ncbi:hypothetical protein [Massilia niastensis]|uniref:hypothetical protein n=1 Tax=Massilia niastensis TaxID=544911 RepID=UPI00036583F5|nr:hypothetical protein [Massilia niastensis]
MHKPKRRQLLGALAWLGAGPALAQVGPSDRVRVYLVPLDDFSEGLAGNMARALEQDMNIRIKSSLRLPPLDIPVLPGTGQYAGEELLVRAAAASKRLPGLLPSTYRVFLTTRDLNAQAGNFRFQFSMHMPTLNSSVVSSARLRDGDEDSAQPSEHTAQRMLKMVKRAVGELHLGWRRSTDRHDLMYAPLMSLRDVDRIGIAHQPAEGGAAPAGAFDSLLAQARDAVADNAQLAKLAGLLLMAGVMRGAASRPETELVGDWIIARHAGQIRGIAAAALPLVSTLMLYKGSELLREESAVMAVLALLFAASAWLFVDVFGSTFRYNDKAVELRRLFRPPKVLALQSAKVERHPARKLFTIRDGAGNAIRFHAAYRTGAVPLVNYLLGRDAPVDESGSAGPPSVTMMP